MKINLADKNTKRALPPQWIAAGVFFAAIVIGAFLLMLPFASVADGSLQPLSAFFTATSAVCVTGLTVIDIGTELTLFGQLVVLMLIQLGGLGIMTIGTFLLVVVGQRLSLQSENVLMNTYGTDDAYSLRSLLKLTIIFTLLFEATGAILLWQCYLFPPEEYADLMGNGAAKPIYYAVFHSISAFCNAGFSLHSSSLVYFQNSPVYMLTVSALVITGGLGFIVIFNITQLKLWRRNLMTRGRISLHSRVVLLSTLVLLSVSTVLILFQEWDNTLGDIPMLHNKICTSFFQAMTPRTAGFNAVPMTELHESTRFTTSLLMFVGGSPGSAAGGIKTTTLFVLIMTIISICKGRSQTIIAHRCVPPRVVREAIIIFLLFLFGVLCAYALLLHSEQPETPGRASNLFFETVSAFATVGLSMDTTPTLSRMGEFIIMVCMYVGRLGPMTAALLIGNRKIVERIRYPEEEIEVG
ncbi:MAG: TrkH family potassium uptake protein [Kiritimatiellia bacterium]